MPQKTSHVRKKSSPDVHSTIRELEQEIHTTREHLQTAMADLETENAQLSGKVVELNRANRNIENLLLTTNITTLFLDAQLCVQKYTPAAQHIFQFLPSDLGRPITQLSEFSQDETLVADIRDVLRTCRPKEQTRQFSQGPQWYFSRITPYQCSDDEIQGVVLTLVDITHLHHVEERMLRFSEMQKDIAAFGQFALQERDVYKVMHECVRLLCAILGVELAKVLELLPDGQSLILRAGIGWKEGLVGHVLLPAGQNSQAGYTLTVDEPVVVADLSQESRFSGPSLLVDHEVVSGMSCIIRDQAGKPHGILGVHTSTRREFLEDDVEVLQTMANILASAIHRKNIETQLQAMKESLENRVEERTRELIGHQGRLRQLSSEIVLAEHRERRRIATELHDYLGQLLVVGKLKISQFQQGELSDSHSSLLNEIEESLDEALTYTRDLISQVCPPVLYDFGLVSAIRWLCEKMLRYELHVTVTSSLPDEILTFSETTTVFIYQVVRELLFNVLKHAQTSEACVEITRDSMEFICFEVNDQGCGFDLSSEKSLPIQHFGLLNARERVEGLGGHFEVHSGIGEGTRVRIKVPRHPKKAESEQRANTLPSLAPVVKTEGDDVIRVVLADDHSIFREGLATLLNACDDIQVVGEAENGEKATVIVKSLRPDVVVMDINMPVMNGIESTRLIKNVLPTTYVIGLSMHSDNTTGDAFFAAGGDQYVCKGDSFNTFAEIIRTSKQ